MQAIKDWCESQLAHSISLQNMHGDAGRRCYYRLHSRSKTMLAVYAPPESEKNKEWQAAHAWLSEAGVRVPRIYAVDLEHGFWLLEDLGDCLLYKLLCSANKQQASMWYERCIDVLLRVQSAKATIAVNDLPAHDASALIDEMCLFNDWFVRRFLGWEPDESQMRAWHALLDVLRTDFAQMPLVAEHGDYQSRNILLTTDDTLALIDFQDAARGSPAYDLVSLLKDCYLRWEPAHVNQWVEYYLSKARHLGLIDDSISAERFMRHFDLIGMQRHLRVLGTFARLALHDGKSAYLQHIPLIMHYIDECFDRYPDLQVFADYWQKIQLLVKKHGVQTV